MFIFIVSIIVLHLILLFYLIKLFFGREYEKFFVLYFLVGIWVPFIQRCFNYFFNTNFQIIYFIYYIIPFILVFPLSIICILKRIRISFILPFSLFFLFFFQTFNLLEFNLLGKSYKLLTTFTFFSIFFFSICRRLSFERLLVFFNRYLPITVLLVFLYSLIQYIWGPNIIDTFWMNNVEFHSLGLPAPLLVRTFGPSSSPALLSFFFSICFIISLVIYNNNRWKLLLLLIVTIAGILLTQVRASLIGVIIIFLFSFFFLRKNFKSYLNNILFIIAIISIVCSIYIIYGYNLNLLERLYSLASAIRGDDVSLHERLQTWKLVGKLIMQNPLGYGLGSSGKYSSFHYLRYIDNGYLTLAFETGIIGVLLFISVNIYILILSFLSYWKARNYILLKISELVFYCTLYFLVVMIFGDFTTLYIYMFIALVQGMFLSYLKIYINRRDKVDKRN